MSREELSDAFISALSESYARGEGDEALQRVKRDSPEKYLQLIAQLVPKAQPAEPEANKYEKMSLQELREFVAGIPPAGGDEETALKAIAHDLPRYESLIRKARKLAKAEGLTWPPLSKREKWMKQSKGQYVSIGKTDG